MSKVISTMKDKNLVQRQRRRTRAIWQREKREMEGKWLWQEWLMEEKTAVRGEGGRRQQRETEWMSPDS